MVLDFGRFVFDSDAAALQRLTEEEAAVYLPFQLGGQNLSAYLVDGDFSWSYMGEERLATILTDGGVVAGDVLCVSMCVCMCMCMVQHTLRYQHEGLQLLSSAEMDSEASKSVVCSLYIKHDVMCADGKAVVVPVLERCELDATLHLAKSQHPKLPPLRLGVTLPKLRFFISPARLHRVMRILHAAMPSALGCSQLTLRY